MNDCDLLPVICDIIVGIICPSKFCLTFIVICPRRPHMSDQKKILLTAEDDADYEDYTEGMP